MSRQVYCKDAIVQAVSSASGNSIVERDNNADCEFNRVVGGVGRTGEGSGVYLDTLAKTTNYTVTDEDHLILCDASAGAITITLPAAVSSSGLVVEVKRVDASTDLAEYVTIDGNASETIDGDAGIFLTLQYESVLLHCDGTGWHIRNRYIPLKTVTKSAAFNAAAEGTVYLVTAASDITATLGAAAVWKGKTLFFKKVDAGGGDVVIDGNASETIDGAATTTTTVDTQYEVRAITSDGTDWHVLSASSPG